MGPGQRLPAIQTLRGCAAVAVVMVHGYDLCRQAGADVTGSVLGALPNFPAFANSGVDLFFVISGFVMAMGFARYRALPGGGGQFLLQRVVRTIPLYWLITALFVLRWTLAGESWSPRALSNAVTIIPLFDGEVFNAPPIFVGWTLAFEWMFYLAVAATIARRGESGPSRLIGLTLTAALAGMLVQSQWGLLRILFNPILAEFGLGVAVHLLWSKGRFARAPWLPLACGLALLALHVMLPSGAFASTHPDDVLSGTAGAARAAVWGVPWAMVVLGAAYVTRNPTLIGRACERVGDASYSIYLMHIVVFAEARAMDWGAGPYDPLAVMGAFVAVSVAAGLAVHQLVERPLLRTLKPLVSRYAGRHPAVAAA